MEVAVNQSGSFVWTGLDWLESASAWGEYASGLGDGKSSKLGKSDATAASIDLGSS
jgi:hypothetical protein